MNSRGVIYCATTSICYLEAALISAMALRHQEPDLSITLISDHPLLELLPLEHYGITPRFLKVNEIDNSPYLSRYIKTSLNTLSPYQETLFLDADILPLQPISELWDHLSSSDFAMVADRLPTLDLCDHIAEEEKAYTLKQLPKETVQFNSGVMLWRDTAATQTLFQQWHQEWQKFQKHDQLALMRAIATTQISVTKLPNRYNTSPRDSASVLFDKQSVHLLHCWGGMVGSGKFRQFAQTFYPDIANIVGNWVEWQASLPSSKAIKPSLNDYLSV
jgi:hypothetical protein